MRMNSNEPKSRLGVGYPAGRELERIHRQYVILECASRLCTMCDTRNNTSSPVISSLPPSYSLTTHPSRSAVALTRRRCPRCIPRSQAWTVNWMSASSYWTCNQCTRTPCVIRNCNRAPFESATMNELENSDTPKSRIQASNVPESQVRL